MEGGKTNRPQDDKLTPPGAMLNDVALPPLLGGTTSQAAMGASQSFTFSVKYRLKEYLEVVRAHARALQISREASRFKRLRDAAIIATFGTAMFFYKTWRVGACTFTLSDDGVTRASRDGTFDIPWSRITAIKKYDSSYLIDTGDGAMPIPFRVLSADQQCAIESWADLLLVEQAEA